MPARKDLRNVCVSLGKIQSKKDSRRRLVDVYEQREGREK